MELQRFCSFGLGSIGEMIPHGYAKDGAEAAEKAIQGGSDMDMESRVYMAELPKLVKEGKVDAKMVDDATGRILTKNSRWGFSTILTGSVMKKTERTG